MPVVKRQPVQSAEGVKFSFDVGFQKSLLRLLCEDYAFGIRAYKFLRPEFFEHEILGWVFSCIVRHVESYGAPPSVHAIQQMALQVEPSSSHLYATVVDQIRQADLRDTAWLRDEVLEFVRRNLFVRALQDVKNLYNSGDTTKAYDLAMEQMQAVNRVTWEPEDRSNYTEELDDRLLENRKLAAVGDAVPTGFPTIDHILNGGLHVGELGIWLAYAKIGKTTMLLQHGMAAVKRVVPTLHVVLEGSRRLVENRYDAAFTGELYANIKGGEMSPSNYRLIHQEFEWLKSMLYIRSYVEKWDVNILDIEEELAVLKKSRGFEPRLIIIDYADLMTGRDKKFYRTETESQRAAYRDVKRLTNRGYAIWTASQAQRPKEGAADKRHRLTSSSIADTYEKVRAADFLGSLNQTSAEKSIAQKDQNGFNCIRLYAEMYRDNQADIEITVASDPDKMRIWEHPGIQTVEDLMAGSPTPNPVGSVQRSPFMGSH